jgi:enamine deaminase RidA (YjgF/YER057c/UK114 family)
MRREEMIHPAHFATNFRRLYCAAGRQASGAFGRRHESQHERERNVPVHRFQNPATIHAPRGYTHVVEPAAPGRTIYISGQVGMAVDGKVAGDFRGQATQAIENLKAALAAAGGGLEHVVKITSYFTDIAQQLPMFREVRDRYFDTKAPPASTAVQVVKLAAPEYLFEIEAIAVVPGK